MRAGGERGVKVDFDRHRNVSVLYATQHYTCSVEKLDLIAEQ